MAFALPVWLAVEEALLGPDCDCGDDEDAGLTDCFNALDEQTVFRMFHLSRPCVDFVTDTVRVHMGQKNKSGLPAEAMMMVTLDFFAHGVSSAAVQTRVGLSLAQCTRVIAAVSEVIADMADRFISFPATRDSKERVAAGAERFCGIPNVLGVLAPAHFKVRASHYERDSVKKFVNSRGFASVVTQIVCDCDGNILSAERCCEGGSGPQEVWDASVRGRKMEEGQAGTYWVVGGNCYNLSKAVLTPVHHPTNEAESRFNEAHAKMLDVMRLTVGSMKCRFRCLEQVGFAEESSLDKKGNIIKACCILHNIAKKFSVPLPPGGADLEPLHLASKRPGTAADPLALKARRELIDIKFSDAGVGFEPLSESEAEESEDSPRGGPGED